MTKEVLQHIIENIKMVMDIYVTHRNLAGFIHVNALVNNGLPTILESDNTTIKYQINMDMTQVQYNAFVEQYHHDATFWKSCPVANKLQHERN